LAPARVTATVYGKVQGVYYRAFASRAAKSLGVRGYTRNLPRHDAVEIVAEGEKRKLEELVKQIGVGSPESLVNRTEVKWSQYTGEFPNFEIRY
jgi:acylphosphatase